MLREDFDRDNAIEARIPSAVHLAHAALAQWGQQFVRAEPCSGTYVHDE
jgi:hypothetical protein